MAILDWFKDKEKLKQIREAKRQEIFLKVKEAIIEQMTLPSTTDITLDARLIDDLGVDSLDTVELVMELEERFEIEIPDEDAELMKTVKDIVDYIDIKLPK